MPLETRFKCSESDSEYITIDSSKTENYIYLTANFSIGNGAQEAGYCLDIPTAIKLSKSIRTEINKIKGVIND